jgi:diacylglycerol kinase family enzyme
MPKDPAELSGIAMAVMQSDLNNCKLIKFFRTRHVTFEMPMGTPWTLDGEKAICNGKVTVANIPKAANLILDTKKHKN